MFKMIVNEFKNVGTQFLFLLPIFSGSFFFVVVVVI